MRLHFRRADCDQYHASVVASRADISKARWDPEEVQLMALDEARLVRQGCRNLNQALADRVPGRSIEAIKGRRRNPEYKTRVAELLSGTPPERDTGAGRTHHPAARQDNQHGVDNKPGPHRRLVR